MSGKDEQGTVWPTWYVRVIGTRSHIPEGQVRQDCLETKGTILAEQDAEITKSWSMEVKTSPTHLITPP